MRPKTRQAARAAVILCAFLLLCNLPAYAAQLRKTIEIAYRDIKIYIGGGEFQPKDAMGNDVEPFIYDGTTYLPVRAISSALGKEIDWDCESNSIYIGGRKQEKITVSTAAEFLNALGSDRRIILKEGVYNLTAAASQYKSNEQFYWNEVFDGSELCLKGIKNLTIEGAGADPSEIIVEPRYAFVLSFLESSNITIDNIKAGHTEGGYCVGGVFSFENSSSIGISGAYMYGCGTTGLSLNNVTGMSVTNSSIYECTYNIMSVMNSKNISFDKCLFRDNAEYDLINIYDTSDMSFSRCEFRGNRAGDAGTEWAQYPFFSVKGSQNISVSNSKFIDNYAKCLDSSGTVELKDNTLEGNEFYGE